MATFVPYQSILYNQNYFTEPCMNCFASVTYHCNEAKDEHDASGYKCIVCPNCKKIMRINFANISLC